MEIYEFHQPVKALKRIRSSDQAAVNLRLKDSAKGAWSVRVSFPLLCQAGRGGTVKRIRTGYGSRPKTGVLRLRNLLLLGLFLQDDLDIVGIEVPFIPAVGSYGGVPCERYLHLLVGERAVFGSVDIGEPDGNGGGRCE